MSKYDEALEEILENAGYLDGGKEDYVAPKLIKKAVDKAQKAEILEEALGCPLEVVFKALKQGYIYFVKNDMFFITKKLKLTCYGKETLFVRGKWGFVSETYDCSSTLLLDNYKKTWWLKEDRSE